MTNNFCYEYLPNVKLERIDSPSGRKYVSEDGTEFVSVTTALGVLSKKGITEWKERVGESEADKISGDAAKKGTMLHALTEDYLLGKKVRKGSMMIEYMFQNSIKPMLSKNVTKIYGIEKQLYSRELCAAGTADLICDYAGLPTVFDIKSSKYIKKKEHITSYFLQCGSYAFMLRELFGFNIEQIVIGMACHHDNGTSFVEEADYWMKKAKNFFRLYHSGLFK